MSLSNSKSFLLDHFESVRNMNWDSTLKCNIDVSPYAYLTKVVVASSSPGGGIATSVQDEPNDAQCINFGGNPRFYLSVT